MFERLCPWHIFKRHSQVAGDTGYLQAVRRSDLCTGKPPC